MIESRIPKSVLMTGQEHVFSGSTPDIPPRNLAQWCMPQGLLEEKPYPIASLIEERQKLGWVRTPMQELGMQSLGHLPSNKNYAVRLEAIDPETGQTILDPRALVGIWDREKGTLTNIEGDLTGTFKEQAEIGKQGVLYRAEGGSTEDEIGGNPERT